MAESPELPKFKPKLFTVNALQHKDEIEEVCHINYQLLCGFKFQKMSENFRKPQKTTENVSNTIGIDL